MLTYLLIVSSLLYSGTPLPVRPTSDRPKLHAQNGNRFVIDCIGHSDGGIHGRAGCTAAASTMLLMANLTEATELHLDLSNCHHRCSLDAPLFSNGSANLRTLKIIGPQNTAITLSASLFDGLSGLEHLELHDFHSLANDLPTSLLSPLTALRHLELGQFARYNITVDILARMIGNLRQLDVLSLLDTMPANETKLNYNALSAYGGHLQVKHFTLHGVSEVAGRSSTAFPFLEEMNCRLDQQLFPDSVWPSIDMVLLHPSIRKIRVAFTDLAGAQPTSAPERCLLPFNMCVDGSNESTEILRNLAAASKPTDDPDCFHGVLLPVAPNLRVSVTENMRTGWLPIDSHSYCFDPGNVVESFVYKKIANRDPVLNWTVKGFHHVKHIDIEQAQFDYISPKFLFQFPNLTTLSFTWSGSKPFEVRRSNFQPQLFRHNPRLRTVDFSWNHIKWVPPTLFLNLSQLEYVDLAGNRIAEVDLVFSTSGKLREMNLRDGCVETLAPRMTKHLDEVFGSRLVLDLRNTSLLCDCVSIEFVSWIKKTNVSLVDVQNYTCTTPSGNLALLSDVDVSGLRKTCAVVWNFPNGSSCPCGEAELVRLTTLQRSVSDLWCTSNGVPLPLSKIDPRTVSDACRSLKRRLVTSWLFTCLALTFLVVVVVALITAIRQRRLVWIRADLRSLMKALAQIVMRAFTNNEASTYDYDVFIFYHDNDGPWVNQVLAAGVRDRLEKTTVTPDHFLAGGFWLDPVSECLTRCRHVVLVVSRDFAECARCQLVANKSLTELCHRLVVVARPGFLPMNYDGSRGHSVFQTIDDLSGIIRWPGDDANSSSTNQFWTQLGDRVRCDSASFHMRTVKSLSQVSRPSTLKRRKYGASLPDLKALLA